MSKAAKSPSRNPTRAAQPTRAIFDPWNSSSTGHQRAENRMSGSLEWRNSRTIKLHDQLRDPEGRGGKRRADTVVIANVTTGRAGSGTSTSGALGAKAEDQQTLTQTFYRSKAKRRRTDSENQNNDTHETRRTRRADKARVQIDDANVKNPSLEEGVEAVKEASNISQENQLFRNLTFYINGCTYPLISDHKLKRMLIAQGGRLSIDLRRRTVTHVILGIRPDNHSAIKRTAGGGLAGGKIQKEIKTGKSSNVRYVSVEWVLECLKRGRRVPEAEFAPGVAVAGRGQQSVLQILKAKNASIGSAAENSP